MGFVVDLAGDVQQVLKAAPDELVALAPEPEASVWLTLVICPFGWAET